MANTYNEQTHLEFGKVKEWLSKDDPVSIITHQRVDADAAFSAALLKILRPHAAWIFVRADAVIDDERSIAVDLSNGESAVKGLEIGSAFGLIVQVMKDIDRPVYDALRRWASQLNKTDSGKPCNDNVVLAELVKSWSLLKFSDVKIVSRAAELLIGKIRNEQNFQKQKNAAKSLSINGGVAIIPEGIRIKASHLFKRGAKAVIRQSKFGQCVNLSREMQDRGILLNELENLLPEGWFVHPDGFMACYGSTKAPKDYRDSGISLDDLTTVIKTWIKSHKNADNFAETLLTNAGVSN